MISESFSRYREYLLSSNVVRNRVVSWLWNMNISDEWGNGSGRFISLFNESVRSTSSYWPELGVLNILLARERDTVWLPGNAGCEQLICYWKEIGIMLANASICAVADNLYSESVSGFLLKQTDKVKGSNFFCFGYGYQEEALSKQSGSLLMGSGADINGKVNSKVFVRALCHRLNIPVPADFICTNHTEILEAAEFLLQSFDRIAIKEPYGTSGKGILLANSINRVRMLMKKIGEETSMSCLVEGWYEHVLASFNTQYLLMPSGEIIFLGNGQQLLKNQVYEGNRIAPDWGALPGEEIYVPQMTVLKELCHAGYYGVVGIDSVICGNGTVFPVIEINGRMNMSTYAFVMLDLLQYPGWAILRSYTTSRKTALNLTDFISLMGEDVLYRKGQHAGVVIMAYTGLSSPLNIGAMRIQLLFLAPDIDAAEVLRNNVELRLERIVE